MKIVLTVKKQTGMQAMSNIATHRFSDALFALGILIFVFDFIYFIVLLLGSLGYQGPRPELGISFIVLIVSIVMIGIGNKKVPYNI